MAGPCPDRGSPIRHRCSGLAAMAALCVPHACMPPSSRESVRRPSLSKLCVTSGAFVTRLISVSPWPTSLAGAHSLGELDVAAICRRHGLVSPHRQTSRRDQQGRWRFLDCEWDYLRRDRRARGRRQAPHGCRCTGKRTCNESAGWSSADAGCLRATTFEVRLEARRDRCGSQSDGRAHALTRSCQNLSTYMRAEILTSRLVRETASAA